MHNVIQLYTVSQKVPSFKLSVTFSDLNRFAKLFALLESVGNLLQNQYDNTNLTLGMLLHYLGKKEIQIYFLQIFSRHGRNANKLHFNRL